MNQRYVPRDPGWKIEAASRAPKIPISTMVDTGFSNSPIPETTPEQDHRTRLHVAEHMRDPADGEEIMRMLGLWPDEVDDDETAPADG